MYTFTDITLTHKKLWHKTFVKNGQICEGCGSLKDSINSSILKMPTLMDHIVSHMQTLIRHDRPWLSNNLIMGKSKSEQQIMIRKESLQRFIGVRVT